MRSLAREKFAVNITTLRKNKGLNRNQAAKEINIAYSYLRSLESTDGEKNPSFIIIDLLAEYYNVEIYELFI